MRKNTKYEPTKKCKYNPGDKVIGKRYPNQVSGIFVRSYVTVNDGFIVMLHMSLNVMMEKNVLFNV